ncbi:MAG: hypothetical protein GY937_04570 [bacterium]|nr:hypothetical protein [bacterium]
MTGAELVAVSDINHADVASRIERERPDLIVSIYFPHKIGRRVRDAASVAAINVHGSYLPGNRGLFPYFWTMARDDQHAGVSVHELFDAWDAGDVYARERLDPQDGECVLSYSIRNAVRAGEVLVGASAGLLAGTSESHPQSAGDANYVDWPAWADIRELWRRGRRLGSPLRVLTYREEGQQRTR